MKRLKEIYNTIKKGLENPRLRALTILGMYAVFFFLVYVLLSTTGKVHTNNKNEENIETNNTITTNYNNVSNNYVYNCIIDYTENDTSYKYSIKGQVPSEEENTVELYNKDTNQYSVVETPDFINNNFILLDKIISYVNDKEYEFSTSYKDGSILKNYKVLLSDINEIYSNTKYIEINVYELNNNIIKVVVDSTNYDKVVNENIKEVIYTIEYQNTKNSEENVHEKDNGNIQEEQN